MKKLGAERLAAARAVTVEPVYGGSDFRGLGRWLAGIVLIAVGGCAHRGQLERPGTAAYSLAEGSSTARAYGFVVEGRRGRALREFLAIERAEKLDDSARTALAGLLVERAQQRLEGHDPAALADLTHAQKFGVSRPTLRYAAYSLAALAAIRHSSKFVREQAPELLAQLGSGERARVLQGYRQPGERSLSELLVLWQWLESGTAKKEALRIAQAYVDRGGNQPAALRQWLALHRWWFGTSQPAVPSRIARTVARRVETSSIFRDQACAAVRETRGGRAVDLARDWGAEAMSHTLSRVIRAYQSDPASAHRLAQSLVDIEVYGARKIAIFSELFFRLGDIKRARMWAERLGALNKNMPSFGLSVALANVAAGDPDRAGIWLTRAAAASGDPATVWAKAARSFRLLGQPLAAINAGKWALRLAASGADAQIRLEISRAQEELGRAQDAGQTIASFWNQFFDNDRVFVEKIVRTLRTEDKRSVRTLLGPVANELGFSQQTVQLGELDCKF